MGTVLHAEQAHAAVTAGAAFLVAPGLRPHVAAATSGHGIPFIMGACGFVYPSKPIKAWMQHLKFRGQERFGQTCEDVY